MIQRKSNACLFDVKRLAQLQDICLEKNRTSWFLYQIYGKQDQQGKAAFNERKTYMTQQQEPVARSPGGPQTKTGHGTRQSTDRLITKMINNL
jgi:hypothetical protein